jgi:FkbM family methyltransferase
MTLALELAWHLPGPIGSRVISKLIIPQLQGRLTSLRTRDGHKMWCDPADFIQRSIIETGMWDSEVAETIRAHLKPGQLFCDIGANIGYFTMLATHLGARVVAIEPQPRCIAALLNNAALNGFHQIDLHEVALDSQNGEMCLYLEGDQNTGAASFRRRSGEVITVRTHRLDDVLTEKPALLKIDVEGAEVRALRGAERILTGPDRPPVICEISEFSLRQLGNSKDELFDLMMSHGYKADVISKIRRSNATTHSVYFQYDVLFRPVN